MQGENRAFDSGLSRGVRFGKELVLCGNMREKSTANRDGGKIFPADYEREGVGIVWKQEEKTNRESARIHPSGEQNRICFSSLSQSSFAVLLIPHRKRSGKSCRRPSASHEEYSERYSSSKIVLLKYKSQNEGNYRWEPLGRRQDLPERSR